MGTENGSNKLRWIGRFALKEGHLCRICHCVHFIVQFAGLFYSGGPILKCMRGILISYWLKSLP